ncbi:MAG: hypothetical protein WCH85_04415 [Methanomicrobiales archaeon]
MNRQAKRITCNGLIVFPDVLDKPGDVKGQGVINSWYVADITRFVPATLTPVPKAVPTVILTTVPTFDYSSDSSRGGGY